MNECLNTIEDSLTYYLLHKGSHSSAIFRCYYIDEPDAQENCVRDIMKVLKEAVEFAHTHEGETFAKAEATNGRMHPST